ncbi:MAG: T9SS type A sorting domain-containing protein [Chitinophagales bacterium]|nr:T9SS type A sorting domain-containing protein [Chitinophagales bacterium]
MMKNNYVKLLFFALLTFVGMQNIEAQCIPTGVRPVTGTVSASVGTFNFTNIPTGNVIRLNPPAAGTYYQISMCATNPANSPDGLNDSYLTMLSANSALATSLATADDGCLTNIPNGWGPTTMNYTATSTASIFIYLTEYNAGGTAFCVADGLNNAYQMSITVTAAPPTCDAGTLTSPASQDVCPGDLGTINVTGNSTPGDYSIGFDDSAGGTGGLAGGFTLTGISGLDFPFTFDEDLNGVLSSNALPVLQGTWILTVYATDPSDNNCDSTATCIVNFLAANNPACGGSGFDASVDYAFISEYSAVPLAQAGSYTPSCDITNYGSSAVTGVSVATKIYDIANTVVYNTTLTQASLAAGATTTLTAATSFTPSAVDFYLVEFIVSINEVDGDASNDTLYTAIDITDSLYARDFAYLTGNVDGAVGVGVGSSMIFGNVFDVSAATELVSVDAFFNGTLAIGDVINARVYNYAANTVGTQVALQSKTITVVDTPVGLITFTFGDNLAPGQYFVAVEETAPVDNMGILYSDEIYTTDRIVANIDNGAFDDVETLTGGAFRIVPIVRANLYSTSVITDCSDLIISEVLEGFSNDKCLEFYNPTNALIDLDGGNYAIRLYANGSATPTSTTPLTGTVQPLSTLVVCNAASSAPFQSVANVVGGSMDPITYYNGNDVIELIKGSQTLDIVGQIGNNANFNLNVDLVRKVDVLLGDVNGADAFAVATEWNSYAANDASHFGIHYSDCNPVCYFDSVVVGTTSACNPANNTYSQSFILYYNNAPTGTINAQGQIFPVTSSPQTITLTGLNAHGMSNDFVAFFTADPSCEFSANSFFTAPASCLCVPYSLSATTTPAVCTSNVGSINLSVSGGTGAYSYSWSPGGATTQDISNLAAGTYQVTITDAQMCDSIYSVTVPSTSYNLNVAMSSTPVTNCTSPDGSATAVVTGGTGAISYAWTPSSFGSSATISSIPSGSYSVVATDANGCTGTGSTNVSNTSGVNAVVSNFSNVSCNGGTNGVIAITATGGTAPINYTWSDQGFATSISTRNNLAAGPYSITVSDAAGCSVVLGPINITQPNALSVTLGSSTNVLCNNGSTGAIDMVVSGGTPNYNYSWSNSSATTQDLSGLSAGTYQLTVTDGNACPSVQGPSVTITQPAALTLSISSQTNVLCNNASTGAVSGIASGGTAPYTYTLGASSNNTGNFNGLAAGPYTMTVTDANSCPMAQTSFTITQPTALSASVLGGSVVDPTCVGLTNGGFTVSASGGTAPYTFTLGATSNNTGVFTGLAAGSYTVTVTDANLCSTTPVTQVLTAPAAISVALNTVTDESCFGLEDGAITVTVTGGQGILTYAWTNTTQITEDISDLAPGSYTLTVTDANNCTGSSAPIVVDAATAITTTISSTPESTSGSADGTATVIATGGAGNFDYLWDDSNGQTSSTAVNLSTGNYTVEVTDDNGCLVTDAIFVDLANGISELGLSALSLYPNPASKNVVLSFTTDVNEEYQIKFYSTIGKLIFSDKAEVSGSFSKSYDLSDLAAGVYLVEISNENAKLVQKLSINR